MSLDAATLFAAMTATECVATATLSMAWFLCTSLRPQHRQAIKIWAFSFLISAVGMLIVGFGRFLPPFWDSVLGNCTILIGLGLRRMAVSTMWNLNPRKWAVAVPPALWIILMTFPGFRHGITLRFFAVGVLMTTLSLWVAYLCLFKNKERLGSGYGLGACSIADAMATLPTYILATLSGYNIFQQIMVSGFYKVFLLTTAVTTMAWTVLTLTSIIEEEARRLKLQANYDSLTGLFTRRAFEARVQAWMDKHNKIEASFCIVLFDLDHFKFINDTFGHTAGDQILKIFSTTCKDLKCPDDSAARWGGEEFLLFLPDADEAHGYALADKIRTTFAEATRQTSDVGLRHTKSSSPAALGLPAVTVSGGIASGLLPKMTLETAVTMADKNLYAAKRAGRNSLRTDFSLGEKSLSTYQHDVYQADMVPPRARVSFPKHQRRFLRRLKHETGSAPSLLAEGDTPSRPHPPKGKTIL